VSRIICFWPANKGRVYTLHRYRDLSQFPSLHLSLPSPISHGTVDVEWVDKHVSIWFGDHGQAPRQDWATTAQRLGNGL
jgi:hypothetical protein